MLRRRQASNRHWVFIKQEILSQLNDELALRHGAEYAFEVPERSFDWDVELSVIKDRSGNTVREQYVSAWLQPSLVGPNDAIYQLGVRLNWLNPDIFSADKAGLKEDEVLNLMLKVDEVLGSPLESEEDIEEVPQERPYSVTKQSSKHIKIANSMLNQDLANKIINLFNQVNNAKNINDPEIQQIEVQKAYDVINNIKMQPKTKILGYLIKFMTDKIRTSEISSIDLYDVLSRIMKVISESYSLLCESPDFKLEALNKIEDSIMNLLNDEGINNSFQSVLKNYSQSMLKKILISSIEQIKVLRDDVLDINL